MLERTSFIAILRCSLRFGHFRSAGVQIMCVALVLLLSGMAMLGADINGLDGLFRQVRMATQTLEELGNIERETIGIEHSVRGMALTGRPEFTGFFMTRRAHLYESIRILKATAGPCGLDRRKVLLVEKMLTKRLAALQPYAVDPKLAQADTARLIVDPTFRTYQRQADLAVTSLKRETTRILEMQQEAMRRKIAETYREAFTIVAVAFLLAALGLFLNLGGSSKENFSRPAVK
jgi:CHASE3 domain sensor protein